MAAYRALGVSSGSINLDTREISFALSIAGRPPMEFVSEFGPATQIIGALGRMFFGLQQRLAGEKGMTTVAGEQVQASHIQKDQWKDVVIMQLTTPQGVPYTFALPPKMAVDISEQLKTESAKPHQTGRA